VRNRPATEPHNLAKGWVGYDYAAAFGCPVRIVNDAAMQALGGYKGGKMLFLGFGTGLGTAMIVDGVLVPMELAHLPYKKATFEDYVREQALLRDGKKKWRKNVTDVIARLTAALEPEDVVLGGGNAREIQTLPPLCRIGANSNAFPGGFRMWDGEARGNAPVKRASRTAGKRATGAKKSPPAAKKATKPPAKKRAAPRKATRARKT
jgi:polyphosphate glucokinase